ncbi:hypothetical protein [Desulfovibrio sp. JC010]|uniref:hypothetical protein n=1 Tax=Desulfovibrio sp. JC010 TaxID=2593641 RepID=UPI0013D3BD48|nr:hypothetical protein [Desulfovibrio sp. JC010]NDV27704.1 hypothetical protein [Desulfovibrio sp. JC010]
MNKERPLFMALKTEHYLPFRSGEKKYEIRQYGKRWNEDTCRIGRLVSVSHGYQKRGRLIRVVTDFKKISGSQLNEADRMAVEAIWGAEALKKEYVLIYC